jgi:hypothetical protein
MLTRILGMCSSSGKRLSAASRVRTRLVRGECTLMPKTSPWAQVPILTSSDNVYRATQYEFGI